MKYSEHGFRPLYKNYCIYRLNHVIRGALSDCPGIDEADGIMVYGYVDHEAGNTLEILALTKYIDDEKYSFVKVPDEARYFLRIGPLMNDEFQFVDYGETSNLYQQFQVKVERLFVYDVNENLARTRTISFLDEFRYDKSFDDVKVILHKDGLELEGVWAKIKSLSNGIFRGILLSEPKQDFGVKAGDQIAFFMHESKDKQKSLIADLTTYQPVSAEDLADGKLLKKALLAFNQDKTNKAKLFAVVELLRDSAVYVPYNKKGVDLLTNEKDSKPFFPAFSDLIEMWQCEENIIKNKMHFMDAVRKAKNNKKVAGIVINAYSDAFVVPRSMFELIEKMESRFE